VTDRLTKQQLKHDPLMDRTAETADFIASHSRTLIFGVLALVLIAAGITYFRTSRERAEDRATGVLADARIDYGRGALEPAAARLDDLLNRMGGTKAGRQGLLLYGNVRYDQGRFAEAETYYREALEHFEEDPLFGPAAKRGLAASLENEGRFAEAAALYRELSSDSAGGEIRAGFLIDAARNEQLAGNTTAALEIYDSVAEDGQAPAAAQLAKLLRAEITTTASSTP
jgi:tetratricopeptide (TPR) repeat protein